jgi:ligand-binding SRPBCC domain-containing protein
MREFAISSDLHAAPDVVWQHATSPAGINREFRPLLRMTFPKDLGDLEAVWRPGERLFRSWMLLFGIVPVEYDDLTLIAVEPGRRFHERSSLLTQRVWEHERRIDPAPGGCRLTDRVQFSPRIAWLGPVYALVFRAVFRLRHWNLRRLFS